MSVFYLHKQSTLSRDALFAISTDVSNFHKIMPKYFKSLHIIDDNPSEKLVLESIAFLGREMKIKTKHIVLPPETHKILILSGPMKGSSFIERYTVSKFGTDVVILVSLKLNGFLKFIPFFDKFLAKRMNSILSEFLASSEAYSRIHPLSE